MTLELKPYAEQLQSWPRDGRHILAQFDNETIVVYQAFRPAVGKWAVAHKSYGEGFSYRRMSWIKTNFLWMMYRSGWGTKDNQELALGLRLRRTFFDRLLEEAVPSTYVAALFPSEME